MRLRARVLWLVVLVLVAACPHRKKGIAELTSADGPVERQDSETSPWKPAAIGTQFFLGDAARTADGGAELKLGNTVQLIAMQPHTLLRFGTGKSGSVQLVVAVGQVKLVGAGKYALGVGDVTLDGDGAVVITAKGEGENDVELTVGKARITLADGNEQELVVGQVLELAIGKIAVTAVIDAGVDALPADGGEVDAAPAGDGTAKIVVTGKHAEAQAAGETKWTALPEGETPLDKGMKVRLGNNTTAKLTASDTSLDLAGGSRVAVTNEMVFSLELGTARISAGDGKVDLPGGELGFKGTPGSPAEARVEVNARETKVTVTKPAVKLLGGNGATLDMNRGEIATLAKAGAIHVVEAIPSYYDMRVTIGETPVFTIHDPKGSTALQFAFAGKCGAGGVIEMDRGAGFRTPKVSSGKESANVLASAGGWSYRLRCSQGDHDGPPVASGRINVLRDDGHRPLPKDPAVNPIDADGRTWRIYYQSLIPNVKIKYPGSGSAFKLHLATGGTEEVLDSANGTFTVPGNKLKEATYTYYVEHDGVKQDKVSTLIILFDQTAPQVYIEAPQNNQPFPAEIEVRGAVLPGWTAKVDVTEIPIDKGTRRFKATVEPPDGAKALAIRLSHPKLGVHFYLRRGK